MVLRISAFVLIAAIVQGQTTSTPTPPQRVTAAIPTPQSAVASAKSAADCLAAVKTESAKMQKDVAAAPPSMRAAEGLAPGKQRLAAACTARFDLAKATDQDLASLIELYSLAGQPVQMKTAVDRALTAPS